jgi:hypothetical protein
LGGFRFLFQLGLILCHPLINFISGALAGVAIYFLQQAGQYIELAGSPIQVVVGEFALPGFSLASDLFPLAFENILVFYLILRSLRKAVPVCAGEVVPALERGARDSLMRRFLSRLSNLSPLV